MLMRAVCRSHLAFLLYFYLQALPLAWRLPASHPASRSPHPPPPPCSQLPRLPSVPPAALSSPLKCHPLLCSLFFAFTCRPAR